MLDSIEQIARILFSLASTVAIVVALRKTEKETNDKKKKK